MLSTQMDKITYPPLWRHSQKTVHNKDIVANQNERGENFLQFAFNPNFLAPFLWILWRFEVKQKKTSFFAIFLKFSMHERVNEVNWPSNVMHSWNNTLRTWATYLTFDLNTHKHRMLHTSNWLDWIVNYVINSVYVFTTDVFKQERK